MKYDKIQSSEYENCVISRKYSISPEKEGVHPMSKVGKPEVRVDGYDKATGRTKYYEDRMPAGALYVRIKHAEKAHAIVKSVDTSKAEAIPGVVKVLTCFDVPEIDFPTAGHPWSMDPGHQDVADRHLLNRHVRYYGDDVAVVIAEDEVSANQGVRALKVEYEELPFVLDAVEAMKEGALGGSYGFMYEPNRYAQPDELLAFAETIAKYDGIVTVHPRACAIISADYPLFSKKSHLELGLDEVVDIMKKARCRLEYSHLIFTGSRSWKLLDKMLTAFHKTRDEGWDIAYDNYAFHYGASVITVVFPAWYAALSKEEAAKPSNKRKLAFTIFLYRKLFGIDWDDLVVAYISDEYRHYEGKTVLDCAKKEGIKPLDMYLKLVELSDRKGSIYLGKYYNDAIVRRLMEDDLSVFMTDAWVEDKGLQNIAAYQTFPQFFVLARKYGIPVEKIVRKMTGATADRFHIAERGYLKEGCKADITVMDFSHMKVNEKTPDAKPEGISHVVINGTLVVEEGTFIGGKAGEIVLRANFP